MNGDQSVTVATSPPSPLSTPSEHRSPGGCEDRLLGIYCSESAQDTMDPYLIGIAYTFPIQIKITGQIYVCMFIKRGLMYQEQ